MGIGAWVTVIAAGLAVGYVLGMAALFVGLDRIDDRIESW